MSRHRPPALLALVLLPLVGRLATPAETPAPDVKKLFEAFLKTPKRETYLPVFKAVTSAATYAPYGRTLSTIGDLIKEGKHKEARAALQKAEADLLLCPRAHFYASIVARRLGEPETAAREADIRAKCIQGILSTGKGTPQEPLLVTRVTDEYDVLRALGKTSTTQGLIHRDGKSFDCVTCTDGSTLWFDITAQWRTLIRRFKKPPRQAPKPQPKPAQPDRAAPQAL